MVNVSQATGKHEISAQVQIKEQHNVLLRLLYTLDNYEATPDVHIFYPLDIWKQNVSESYIPSSDHISSPLKT